MWSHTRHYYDDATYHYALDIVEDVERQNPHLKEES